MRHVRVLVAAVLVVATLLAGCGDDGGGRRSESGGGGERAGDAQGRRDPDRRRRAAVPRRRPGLLRGGGPDDRAAARRGRRGDRPVGRVRRLPDRLLQHDVADHRRRPRTCRSRSSPRACSPAPGPDDAWDGVIVPKGSDIKDAQGPRGQDRRGQHAQQRLADRRQHRAGEGGRRLQEGQVRRGPVPGHERRAGERARRRRLPGRAGLLGRAGGRRRRTSPTPTRRWRRTTPSPRTSRASSTSPRTATSSTGSCARWRSRSSTRPSTTTRCGAIVGTYTEIPQEVLDKMNLPVWKADLNEPTIEQTVDRRQGVRLHRGEALARRPDPARLRRRDDDDRRPPPRAARPGPAVGRAAGGAGGLRAARRARS